MIPAARVQAAIEVLDDILAGKPAEQALTGWARRSRFAGSGDRAAVRDHVFEALRRKRSHAALGGAETGRGLLLGALRQSGAEPATIFSGARHCPPPLTEAEESAGRNPHSDAERLDIPDWLWPDFRASLGDAATGSAAALQRRAPIWLRVNLSRAGRDKAIEALRSEDINSAPHPSVKSALMVTDGARKISSSAAYRDGLVELQDASSQAVIDALPLASGMRVLDFCAGGGGKALALADIDGVRVAASDIDPRRMCDLPERARRAGVTIDLLSPDAVARSGPFDIVLVDAPCSGTGSWRRAPAGKWSLTPEKLAALIETQARILDDAAALTAPDGLLAYATCSVLRSENTEQVAAFLARNTAWTSIHQRNWPVSDEGDGFLDR